MQMDSSIAREFNVTPKRLRIIATSMALYLFLVVWPVSDCVRYFWAGDPGAFSLQRMLVAFFVALGFGIYAYLQMRRLTIVDNA